MEAIILRKTRKQHILALFPYEVDGEDGKNMVIVFRGKKSEHTFKRYETVMKNSEHIEEDSDLARRVLSELYWRYGYHLEQIKERDYEKYMAIWTKSIMDD